ncbi:tetratricopeptide repeat protein [Pseudanabaena sp. FACHB-1998]|uniref:tetratricopeptide repeat protein n=1 Tax=Pseudanabaena sp. FACHB-1998 TaxID=2692858 RepID=UPI001680C29C|nr:tetratricopeptide repeat protein [Pseudanabaena sp. FACHB-1998]MBD2175860.1 tetratricopeptide repeat protein [Pseudanabaena sp. FACHB-1998]
MQGRIKIWQGILFCSVSTLTAISFPEITFANARITSLTPNAIVVRDGASQRARFGMVIKQGDLIKPEIGSVLEIMCTDGQVRTVGSGTFSGLPQICPQSVRIASVTRGDRDPSNTRSEDDFLKYLGLRFYTVNLLDAKQVIRWQPRSGTTGYQVQVGTRQKPNLLDRQVNCPKVSYVGDQPLEADTIYNLLVKSVGVNNSEFRLRFKVLSEKSRKEVSNSIAVIEKNQGLPEIAKAIALADIYNDYGLAEQAIAVLEKASQSGQSVAIVEQMLGNSYLQIGLREIAELHYRRALDLAKSAQNPEVVAEAEIGLAKVFVVNGNKEEAKKYLELALANYTSLKDNAKIQQVGEWISKVLDS